MCIIHTYLASRVMLAAVKQNNKGTDERNIVRNRIKDLSQIQKIVCTLKPTRIVVEASLHLECGAHMHKRYRVNNSIAKCRTLFHFLSMLFMHFLGAFFFLFLFHHFASIFVRLQTCRMYWKSFSLYTNRNWCEMYEYELDLMVIIRMRWMRSMPKWKWHENRKELYGFSKRFSHVYVRKREYFRKMLGRVAVYFLGLRFDLYT